MTTFFRGAASMRLVVRELRQAQITARKLELVLAMALGAKEGLTLARVEWSEGIRISNADVATRAETIVAPRWQELGCISVERPMLPPALTGSTIFRVQLWRSATDDGFAPSGEGPCFYGEGIATGLGETAAAGLRRATCAALVDLDEQESRGRVRGLDGIPNEALADA